MQQIKDITFNLLKEFDFEYSNSILKLLTLNCTFSTLVIEKKCNSINPVDFSVFLQSKNKDYFLTNNNNRILKYIRYRKIQTRLKKNKSESIWIEFDYQKSEIRLPGFYYSLTGNFISKSNIKILSDIIKNKILLRRINVVLTLIYNEVLDKIKLYQIGFFPDRCPKSLRIVIYCDRRGLVSLLKYFSINISKVIDKKIRKFIFQKQYLVHLDVTESNVNFQGIDFYPINRDVAELMTILNSEGYVNNTDNEASKKWNKIIAYEENMNYTLKDLKKDSDYRRFPHYCELGISHFKFLPDCNILKIYYALTFSWRQNIV